MTKVVILRPEPGASETLSRALEAGLDAVSIPLFEVAPVAWQVPDPAAFDALLLTSANAVRHGGAGLEALRELPTYCVGDATAATARAAGLTVAGVGTGGAAALGEQVPSGLRLLHLAGVDYQPIDAVSQVAVYASRAIDPPPALDLLADGVALVHSPRAGARLADLVTARETISIAAISGAAARACGEGWRRLAAIELPTDGTLLALAAALCEDQAQ